MKATYLVLALLLLVVCAGYVGATSAYCDGFELGFCEGYKYIKGEFAICPLAPLCPLPELGRETYRDGYNRGFAEGMKRAKKGL